MYDTRPEKWQKMFIQMANTHKDEMHSIYLDWKIVQIYHPHYEKKIDQLLPMVVIDFK
jgi:hypothetical protein